VVRGRGLDRFSVTRLILSLVLGACVAYGCGGAQGPNAATPAALSDQPVS
jgi:hypothetical protein